MDGGRQTDRARILFREDIEFSGVRLSQILQGSSWELIECDCQEPLREVISNLDYRPDLLILSTGCANLATLEEIREVRGLARNRQIPILGVTTFAKDGLDIPLLRAHGVVGLVDKESDHEVVIRRINSIVEPLSESRFCERVPCFLPVEIAGDTYSMNEIALDLSTGGIRLTTRKPIELNTYLKLRFRLPMVSDNLIEIDGRVVHRLPRKNSAGRYEIGVFFYPMSWSSKKLIANEMMRLLSA